MTTDAVIGNDLPPSTSPIIRLNVGGSLFSTTRQTLLREENSIFTQMLCLEFKGLENSILVLPDGTFFIDRDGFLFAYVLEYLRLGKLILPDNFHNLTRLREEARFYRLESLEEQILAYNATKFIPLGDGALTSSAETGKVI
ncbi:unnamed protein product [Gongylonema pulchrum]|uniref:BTB domain-containing protein n=1 Tax=Gongylonema pulchrum TaxID=637853 RepID=A0A183EKA6_9BILA|nr:unnamed protein product [Gongylonema pulchrum]